MHSCSYSDSKCLSESLADSYSNWTELTMSSPGAVHTQSSCSNRAWEFLAICEKHPDKKPDRHCPLLPSVYYNNDARLPCGGCGKVEPIALRFG
jgi:hypothetical protein